jgi:tetrahydromethanopterin S-methyltransferase subunit C
MRNDNQQGDEANERVSLVSLLRRIPQQISRLVRDEVAAAKLELTEKLKAAGLGAGLLVGAAVFGLFAFGVLLAAAVAGLSTVLPVWLSALIVAVLLLVVAGVLALLGVKKLKTGVPPLPTESIDSVKADIRTVKGTNR